MSPTPRTAALVAGAAVTALFVPWWATALLVLAILSAAAFDAYTVRSAPETHAVLPALLARGVPARFAVRPRVAGAVHLRQTNVPALAFDPQEGEGALEGHVLPRLRGRHDVPAPAAAVSGVLGLGRWRHSLGETSAVVVYPDLPAARRIVRAVREGGFGDPGGFRRGPLGLGTAFESVREYSPDDDFRQVNWRATARVGRPMTNQYRVERDRDLVCVLDAGRLMAAPVGPDRTRLDAALDAVTAVALVADEIGDRCGVVAFDSEVRRELKPQRAGGRRVVEATFDLEPTERDSDYELAFRTVAGGKRALVLVFTDVIDEAAARSLLSGAPFLARRHHLVIAGVADPDLDEMAAATGDPAGEATAAVARSVLDQRAVVVERLRRAGAAVVDAAPDKLASACVAAYLRAKSRVRL